MNRREAIQAGGLAAVCGLFAREAKAQGFTITSVETRNVVLNEPNFSAEIVAHTTAPKDPLLAVKANLTKFHKDVAGIEWEATYEFYGLTVIPDNEIPVKMLAKCRYGKMIDADLQEVECTLTTTFKSGREHTAEYTPIKGIATMGKWPTDNPTLHPRKVERRHSMANCGPLCLAVCSEFLLEPPIFIFCFTGCMFVCQTTTDP